MLRFASLGSGSRGNAALVASADFLVLIDCGFSLAETQRRLERFDIAPEQVDAILVTHEHGDHIAGVGKFARRHGTSVWMTRGTHRVWKDSNVPELHFINPLQGFSLGDMNIQPYPVPHDAREPCQFVVSSGGRRLGILSDTGRITPHICEQLQGCDGLLLECNHDPQMLADGPYAEHLKQRVGGPLGHLSNAQSADLLSRLDLTAVQQIAITHISETNNTPELVRAAIAPVVKDALERITLADQDHGLAWTELH
jgi:phosphoribosyl 1,2-cyclic phosphodiesterase